MYVVYLRNPRGDGKAAYYVGMTGLSPEQRFQNHKQGIKAALAMGTDEVNAGKPFFGAEITIEDGAEMLSRFVVSVGASPLK